MNVVEQIQSAEACEVGKRPFSLNFLMNYSQQKVYDECAPNLYFDGVFVVAKKKL
jgi:hypothetical protein